MIDGVKIPVGIVLFNPDIGRLKKNINAIYENASEIILINNGSTNRREIDSLVMEYCKIQIIHNPKNYGIARALNQICDWADQNDYEYIITLDQDSISPDNLFEDYIKNMNLEKVGILCPLIRDRNHNLSNINFDGKITEVKECITSASMVWLECWKTVHGFDEAMFIDGVDFDFCDRIKKHGYKIVRVNSVILLHEIGHIRIRKFLFWNVRVKNHSAFRKYYIARNTIYLARKRERIVLILKAYLQVLKQLGCVLLYEKQRCDKLQAIIRGAIYGQKMEITDKWK